MIKHTKAPWHHFMRSGYISILTNDNDEICNLDDCNEDMSNNQRLANAKLIAKAPEMLELLKRATIELKYFYREQLHKKSSLVDELNQIIGEIEE